MLRPPFALERISLLPSGEVAYKMKRALPDGTETLVLAPTDFLRRIASLVPPPRRHLVKYFGLLAPHARDREVRVPRTEPEEVPTPAVSGAAPPAEPPVKSKRPTRIPWADLLQKIFAINVFSCDRCGGRRRVISAITDAAMAHKILAQVGLSTCAPDLLPARAPPPAAQLELGSPPFYPCFDPPCMVE